MKNYGVAITDSPLAGITARAVVVLDENDKVIHAELVPEIKDEPNYDAAWLRWKPLSSQCMILIADTT